MFSKIIWLYGMSGAGKTTLGKRLSLELSYLFVDSDYFRQLRWVKPDFTPRGRKDYQNILRSEVAKLQLSETGGIVVASITPYEEMRELNRLVFKENYLEILLDCGLDTLIARDPKGLYLKAAKGEIPYFTGITDSFEKGSPDLLVNTNGIGEEESYKMLLEGVRTWLLK